MVVPLKRWNPKQVSTNKVVALLMDQASDEVVVLLKRWNSNQISTN